MKIRWNSKVDSTRNSLPPIEGGRIRIGRADFNELQLDNPFVAEEAGVLYKRSGQWELVVLASNGIQVDGEDFFRNDRVPIRKDVEIVIFPFTISLDLPSNESVSAISRRAALDDAMSTAIASVHLELLQKMPREINYSCRESLDTDRLLALEESICEAVNDLRIFQESPALLDCVAGHTVRTQLVGQFSGSSEFVLQELAGENNWSRLASAVPDREMELNETCQYFTQVLKIDRESDISKRMQVIDRNYWDHWEKVYDQLDESYREYLALRYFKKQIKDVVFGFGPLEDLLRMPTISEIMVVDQDKIFIENSGVLENSGRRFISDQVTLAIIERIVSRVGRRIDKSQPIVDARLHDGSRVNAVIPPVAVTGPCITIRKFSNRKIRIDDLIDFGSLTKTSSEFLRAAVLCRKNILVSGGTGTGKTTLLNCLSDFIPNNERIVTVEDTAELQLKKQHVVTLETKQANVEGAGELTIRDLVKNSLRMRPDRIVVGECRGAEALDMLQAMNTGHDGSMTTIHANSAEDVILRLEVLVQMAADLPITSIHRQIGSAIDLVVQLHRMRCGRRCVVQIAELQGFDRHRNDIRIRDLFIMNNLEDSKAALEPTGYLPSFMEEAINRNFMKLEVFYQ